MRTQEQLSQHLVGPTYKHPDNGNEFLPKGNLDSQRNREVQISRDTDNVESIRVSIRDIDEAILYYFENVINPQVMVGNTITKVPVVYANPEKWYEVQKEGVYRDKNGKKQLPIIMFKRDSISKNRKISTKLDANRPHNVYVTGVRRSPKNAYTRFEVISNRVPEIDFHYTVIPDFVDLQYSCIVLTSLVSQMNPIVESITFASDSYWGNPEKFKFQTFVSPIKTDISTEQDQDRLVKSSFELKMTGYVLPETVNSSTYTAQKRHNIQSIRYSFTEGVL